MSTCSACGHYNDELEDRCGGCGSPIVDNDLATSSSHIHIDKSTAERKLKANDSHPEAPNKKTAAPDMPTMLAPQPTSNTTHDPSTSRIEQMMHAMMHDMKEMKSMMKESKDEASAAKESAAEARSTVKELRTDVGKLQETAVTKEQVQSMVDTAVKTAVDTKLQSVAKVRHDSDNPATIVIGGLESMSFLEADNRIRRRLTELHLPDPLESYHKGDGFHWTAEHDLLHYRGCTSSRPEIPKETSQC